MAEEVQAGNIKAEALKEWGIKDRITTNFDYEKSIYEEEEEDGAVYSKNNDEKENSFDVPFFVNIPKSLMAKFQKIQKHLKASQKEPSNGGVVFLHSIHSRLNLFGDRLLSLGLNSVFDDLLLQKIRTPRG